MENVKFFVQVQGETIELPFNAIEKQNGKIHFVSDMDYNTPIKTRHGLIRNNGLKTRFYFEPLEIEPKKTVEPVNDVPKNWEQIDALKLPELRSQLEVGPQKGLTAAKAKILLAKKLGIEIPNDTAKVDVQPKTAKVEPQVFAGKDAPQVDATDALTMLVNALDKGLITVDTYVSQIQLLQKNGIIK